MTEQYLNNPLHGLKLEMLLTELVDFYGWEILAAALNFNCFKLNPSIKGSVKFLKKTEWARHKLEGFYLYRFKNLPRPDDKQFALPPRDRIIPPDQKPKDPVILTLEELAKINERKQAKQPQKTKSNEGRSRTQGRSFSRSNERSSEKPLPKQSPKKENTSNEDTFDPWANAKKMLAEKSKDE